MKNGKNKAAIVTGAGQGIGRAIAVRLLGEGYAVALAELDEEAGRETEAELGELGEALFVQTDVAEEQDVGRLVKTTLDRFGRIDAVVNNAGIAVFKPLSRLSLQEWQRVLAVNLTGAFLLTKHASRALKRARGAIVNIASTRALMSEPNTEAYSASKGGLLALTHATAISLGPEVRVNCISPGWIEVSDWKKRSRQKIPRHSEADLEQHPVGRVGHPADVAALVSFLLGPESGFVSGANFVVDGGMTRKMIYTE